MKTNNPLEIELKVNCSPFTGEEDGEHMCLVNYGLGEVRVWDVVARHYTACHRLTPEVMASIVQIARETAKNTGTEPARAR